MTQTQTATKKAAIIAEKLGVQPDEIKVENPRWLNLLQEGVIVRLHAHRWRARTSLDLSDLGLPGNDGAARLYGDMVDLGAKYLMPKKVLKNLDAIEVAARQALKKYSFQTYWGHFVPVTAYGRIKEILGKYRQEYDDAVQNWLERYDDLVAQVLESYAELARIAYRRRHRLQAGQDQDHRYLPEDAYVDSVVTRVRSLIPSKEEVKESCGFEIELSYIPLPSLLAADIDRAAEIQINTAKKEAELAMHRDVLSRARAEAEERLQQFLADFTGQLWGIAYNACVDVLKTCSRNGYLHPRSVVQLRNIIDQLRALNFTDNEEINSFIAKMASIVETPASERSPDEVLATLRSIGVVARQTLIALGEPARSGAHLGIPDAPPAALVAEARQRIGLAAVQPQAISLSTPGGKKL